MRTLKMWLVLIMFLVDSIARAATNQPSDIQRAFAKKFEVGPLKIYNLDPRSITLRGVEYHDGEKFYRINVNYSGEKGGATAELSPVKGKIRSLKLDALVAFLPDVPVSHTILKIEPNGLLMELHAQNSILETDFGSDIPLQDFYVRLYNTTQVTIKRPPEGIVTNGELELNATDLKTDKISLSFEGESDKLTADANVSLPGASFWSYDLSKTAQQNPAKWISGTLIVAPLKAAVQPPHDTNFGGINLDLSRLTLARLELKKDRADPDINAVLAGFEVCATKFRLRAPDIRGELPKCLTVDQIQGRAHSRGEYFDISDLEIQNANVALANATFADTSGTGVSVKSALLILQSYHDTGRKNPGHAQMPPIKHIAGTLDMADGEMAIQGNISGTATITKGSLTIAGDPDHANGNGSLTFSNISVHGAVVRPITDLIPQAQCSGTQVGIDLLNAQVSNTLVALALREGSLSADGRPQDFTVNFNPKYARCEWDSLVKEISYDMPCWSDLFHMHWCTIKHRIEVHWVAELNPNVKILAQYGWIRSPQILIDKGQTKFCGRLSLIPNLWLVSVSPNFNDCGDWWCNIARDFVKFSVGAWESIFVSGIGAVIAPFGIGLCS